MMFARWIPDWIGAPCMILSFAVAADLFYLMMRDVVRAYKDS